MRTLSLIILAFSSVFSMAQNSLSLPYTTFTYTPSKCQSYLYQTGSIITIPEDAFVLPNGLSCDEAITVKYRELHTPSQIVASGISMTTKDSKGQKKHLVSGGMFEIEAICTATKQTLKLKKGKKIDLLFKTYNDLEGMVLWQYSYSSKNWNRKNNPISSLATNQVANDDEDWGSGRIPLMNGGFIEGDGNSVYLTPEEFQKYQKEQEELRKRDSIKKEVFKSIQIDELGFYNCDKILEGEEPLPLLAFFQTPTEYSTVYVVYRSLNTVFTYEVQKGTEKPITFYKREGIEIFVLDESLNLYQVPNEQTQLSLLVTQKGKKTTFEFLPKGKISNWQQLALKTGIK